MTIQIFIKNYLLMDYLLKTELFSLLPDASQFEKEKIQSAYDDFVNQVKAINHSENDYVKVFRMLSISRIELDCLGVSSLYGQGKKMP